MKVAVEEHDDGRFARLTAIDSLCQFCTAPLVNATSIDPRPFTARERQLLAVFAEDIMYSHFAHVVAIVSLGPMRINASAAKQAMMPSATNEVAEVCHFPIASFLRHRVAAELFVRDLSTVPSM